MRNLWINLEFCKNVYSNCNRKTIQFRTFLKDKKALTIFRQNLDILITVSSSGVARVLRRVRRSVFDAAVLSTRVCASILLGCRRWQTISLQVQFIQGPNEPKIRNEQETSWCCRRLAAPRSSSVGWWWRRFGPTSRFCPWRKKKVPIKYVFMLFCFKQPRKPVIFVLSVVRKLSGCRQLSVRQYRSLRL